MFEYKLIYEYQAKNAKSQDRINAIQIVAKQGYNFPISSARALTGTLTRLGNVDGVECFRLDPNEKIHTVIGFDLDPIAGTSIHSKLKIGDRKFTIAEYSVGTMPTIIDLKSGTILSAKDGAIVEVPPAIALAEGMPVPISLSDDL